MSTSASISLAVFGSFDIESGHGSIAACVFIEAECMICAEIL